MGYKIVRQYRAYGGLGMNEDGFVTRIDPSYHESEIEDCSAYMNFDAGLDAVQRTVMAMARM